MTNRKLTVAGTQDLGPQLTQNPHQMIGQDGAYSFPLGNGKSFWFFGDTLMGARIPGDSLWFPGGVQIGPEDMGGRGSIERMVTNCGLLLSDATGSEGLKHFKYILDNQGQIKQLIPRLPDEHKDQVRIWCLHGFPVGDRLYLYYIKVTMLAEGPLPVNFYENGSGLAVGSTQDWEFERVKGRESNLFWVGEEPRFGTTALPHRESGFVYLYGVAKDAAGTQQCYLARVGFEDVEHWEKYEYLISDNGDWSRVVSHAVPLFSEVPNEMSVSFNPHLGCYLAVHSFGLSGKIVGRTADNPWGPWSEPTTLWTIHPQYEVHPSSFPLLYAGKEHPEISGQEGRVLYLTYIEFEEYFPHLVEVTLGD